MIYRYHRIIYHTIRHNYRQFYKNNPRTSHSSSNLTSPWCLLFLCINFPCRVSHATISSDEERSGSLFLMTMCMIMRRDEASDFFPESSDDDRTICRRIPRIQSTASSPYYVAVIKRSHDAKLDFSPGSLIACPPCDLQTAVNTNALDRRPTSLSRIIFQPRGGLSWMTRTFATLGTEVTKNG